jgi:8-oxo-dGTP diphosphatase
MTDQQKQNVSVRVAVLVMNGDRILLEKRANVLGKGTWAPPIGHLDYGETLEQTALREVQEETGLEIADPKFRLLTNDIFEAENEQSITIWMEAKYVSGEPRVKAPKEESDIGWFQWNDLPQPLFLSVQHVLDGQTYPSQTTEVKLEQVMERVMEKQAQPVTASQDELTQSKAEQTPLQTEASS